MHMGRKVMAIGLAAVAVGAATGTALAASGGSSTSQATATSVLAANTSAQQPQLTKMTMTQLTAKLGSSEKQMVVALDDVKLTLVKSGKLSHDASMSLQVKILATDLGISGAAATWAIEEINGGYVPTYVNWGFPTTK